MNNDYVAPAEQSRFAEIGETTDSYDSPLGAQTADRERETPKNHPGEKKDTATPQAGKQGDHTPQAGKQGDHTPQAGKQGDHTPKAGRQDSSRTPREAVERAMAKARQMPDSDQQAKKPRKTTEESTEETAAREVNEQKNEVEGRREKPQPPKQAMVEDTATPQASKQGDHTPQAGQQETDAPRRFHDIARREWNETPQSVRAEVRRSLAELENGLNKYRQSHEKYEALRDYDEMAARHGMTVKDALDNYSGIERLLHQDPVAALERIVANVAAHKQWRKPDGSPVEFRDLAAQYLNMPADQVASRQDATIRRMNEQIALLASRSAKFEQAMRENRMRDTVAQIQDFSVDHPRLDELADDVAFLVESGRAANLRDAYELAERMNPVAPPPTPAHNFDAAQTRDEQRPANMAGQKSVSGAPATGSDPRFAGKPSRTPREALLKALRKAQ